MPTPEPTSPSEGTGDATESTDAPASTGSESGEVAGTQPEPGTGGAGEEPAGTEIGPESEGTGASSGTSEASAQPPAGSGTPGGTASVPAGGAMTSGERRDGLNNQLDASLREFDGLIMREQGTLDGRREEAEAAGGGGSGASGMGTGSGTGELDGDGSNEDARMAGGTGASPDQTETDQDPDGSPSAPGGTPDATEDGRVPADVGDGRDDDIVARQLREAAMSEQDPRLREKLWDEYRAYKRGTK